MLRRLGLAALALLLAACSGERDLAGAEIQVLFSGHTVEGHHDVHGYDFRSYYEPTGTFRSYQNGAPTPRTARWWIAGDDICIRWDDEGEDLCRAMVVDRGGTYRKVKVLPGGERKIVVTFKSFTPGNPGRL